MLWNQMIAENPREIQRWHQYIYVAYFLSSVTLSSLPCWHLSGNITDLKKRPFYLYDMLILMPALSVTVCALVVCKLYMLYKGTH
jgi:hypothetical protein